MHLRLLGSPLSVSTSGAIAFQVSTRGHMEPDTLMTLTDIAEAMDVSRWAVQQWKKDPDWPSVRGSVIRSGRQYPGYKWGEVVAFCDPRGLPKRAYQEGVRRSLADRQDDNE